MIDNSSHQISLRKILGLTSLVAVALALDIWIVRSKQFDTEDWFPFIEPPLGMLDMALIGSVVLPMPLLIVAVVMWARCRPVPLTPLLFASCLPMVFMTPPSAAMRILLALCFSSLCQFAEARIRKLPWQANCGASCCLAIALCYWVMISMISLAVSV